MAEATLARVNELQRGLRSSLPPFALSRTPVPVTKPAVEAAPVRRFKWATAADSQYRFDFGTAVPHTDIDNADFGKARGVQKSDSGAEGVFFVEADGGAVVVKSGRWSGPAMLATLLGTRLGVYVPRCRVVLTNSAEGLAVLEGLRAVDAVGTVTTSLYDLHYLSVIEYVTGYTLNALPEIVAASMFDPAAAPEPGVPHTLKQLGAIMAFDMLCNNGDRLPCSLLWDNPGNGANVMFSGQVAVAIDSQVSPVSAKLCNEYVNRVSRLLSYITSDGERRLEPFEALRGLVRSASGHELCDSALEMVHAGFVEAAKRAMGVRSELGAWVALLRDASPPLLAAEVFDMAFFTRVLDVVDNYFEE